MSVSVLILTLNEEVNLPDCLRAVAWSDDVVVFDSGSEDATPRMARQASARLVQRPFDDYSTHRNWALDNIEFRHEWVLSLDADERVPTDLRDEILATVAGEEASEVAAYRMRYKNILNGRWLRRTSLYPTWLIRLLRPSRVRYEPRSVNAHPLVYGKVGALRGHFEHHSFNRGFDHWFDKHNRYSAMEARECLAELRDGSLEWEDLFSADPLRRRRALKNLSMRMPFRPWARFLYTYLIRMGFLDGLPGLTYCSLQAIYEYMICVKMKELQNREENRAA